METDKGIIELLLEAREWDTFECKRAACKPNRLMECINAFANTEGGTIVIGLEDPDKANDIQRLLGISENPDNVSDTLKLITQEFDPPLKSYKKYEVDIINLNKAKDKLLVLIVAKSNDIHSLKNGDTFVRKGRQNIKIGGSEIIRLKYERGSLKFEDEVAKLTKLDDLDKELLYKYKSDTESQNMDDWQFLKDNGLSVLNSDKYFL